MSLQFDTMQKSVDQKFDQVLSQNTYLE